MKRRDSSLHAVFSSKSSSGPNATINFPRSSLTEFLIPRVKNTRRLKVLTNREARIVHALAETFFPSDGNSMPSVDEAGVVEYFDDLLAELYIKEKLLIRAMLVLFELQSLVFNGLRPTLFTDASPEDRTKTIAGWETSSIFERRLTFYAIRTLLLWGYVDSVEVEHAMGLNSGTRTTARRQADAKRALAMANDYAGQTSTTLTESAAEEKQ